MTDACAALHAMIRDKAFAYRPDNPFTLASGRKSPLYFNCKAVSLTGRGADLLGRVLHEHLAAFPGVRAVGGLTLGADPLALALALRATQDGQEIDAFIVRKEAKGHGTQVWVEGTLPPACPVVVLDDVITTGGSTVKAIQRAATAGLSILGAMVLVDRQEDSGADNVRNALADVGAPFGLVAVFRAEDFVKAS